MFILGLKVGVIPVVGMGITGETLLLNTLTELENNLVSMMQGKN